MHVIESVSNERVKRVVRLGRESSLRRAMGLTVVEGRRELDAALSGGCEVVEAYWCEAMVGTPGRLSPDTAHFSVTPAVYAKMAYRESTEGVLAVVRVPQRGLADFAPEREPLILVVEGVEKPGNLGAMFRTADAAGVSAVMVCDAACDLYNPNVIRSSIGAVFTVPAFTVGGDECIAWLKAHGVQILTAQLQDSLPYYDVDMTVATALVMGTEATGLTDRWRRAADRHILIPMAGKMDSLNVSVSAAILTFEAVRQRRK